MQKYESIIPKQKEKVAGSRMPGDGDEKKRVKGLEQSLQPRLWKIDPRQQSERRKDEIPFHVPHKKVLERIEHKVEIPEPLSGFRGRQEDIEREIWRIKSDLAKDERTSLPASTAAASTPGKPVKIMVEPKKQLPNAEDSAMLLNKLKQPPEVANQLKLVEMLRNDKKIGFVYMAYAVDRTSEYFTPYALKLVPYKELGKTYMTLSLSGVTQYSPEETTFTPLELWLREYGYYLRLVEIKTFAKHRMWKAFYVWRKSIRVKKFLEARDYMESNLFLSNPILSTALLEIKAMCSVFFEMSFLDSSSVEKLPLFLFIEMQLTKLESVREKLDELRRISLDIVYNACLAGLFNAGYTPDDSNITIEQTAYGKLGQFGATKYRMPRDGVLRMSYIEQAEKRKKCYRLCCFIHLVDYMVTSMMRGLLRNTYIEFLENLASHASFLPDESVFLEEAPFDQVLQLQRSSSCPIQNPYFMLDFLVGRDASGGGTLMDPSEEIFRYVFATLQSMWEENLDAIKPLLSDPYFHSFTKPTINHKIVNTLVGQPPLIRKIVKKDGIIIDLKKEVTKILDMNFRAVRLYAQRFRPIHQFYTADINFDESIIRENEKCDIFRKWCVQYRTEIEVIEGIIDQQALGIFFIQLERFKKGALVAPTDKQRILEIVMPGIGRSKVTGLLTEAVEAISFLDSEPTSTDDYVNYIKFVDKAQQKVDNLEAQLDYVKELYDIMEEYGIPVSSDDTANYLGISVEFTSLRLAVDKRLEERQKLISRFNLQIQKDITTLVEKISMINDEALQPWLLNINSDAETCTKTLRNLTERLSECSNLASEYRNHQKGFKLEITRFEILEDVTNQVRLRSLLWESVASWSQLVDDWFIANLDTLNVEEMTTLTMKYLKNIAQLEKGLPANNILPKLKEEVETIKDKLPIISYLRNPHLKARHWLKIENLLNYKFKTDESINLETLESLGGFAYPNELMEIAASASSEWSLEAMLKKVELTWKSMEFIVLPHKDAKDVYVLGSLEEIQTALDESNINIQTIAASRHVGPIKPRLDDWVKQLELFSKTLEAWQYCQQQWMYLEAIFSAPDIQRQLPVEAKLFILVDKSWKDIMRRTRRMPLALESCTQPGLLEQLEENNRNLDQILKCLEAYLETKRIAFPRFFFLSNDELLEILAQTKNPHAVQRHLQKCFDAIYRLEFAAATPQEETLESTQTAATTEVLLTTDILSMISPEGEKVGLGKGLKARGNVEDWLGKVEESMFATLKRRMKMAMGDLETRGRQSFLWSHPSQIVLTVSQIFWAQSVHLILDSGTNVENSMRSFEQKCYSNLNQLAAMVRSDLPKLIREIIINLITVDVHARDTITTLVENKVTSSSSFDWMKALRYYWQPEMENCLARMSNAEYPYGYEYLGAQRRLVITPLTDKCYLCLMGALQLDLGGAPAGPAGTGKTETTKDLAKALAIQCVVFNCSEGLDFKMMGRFFSGLATSGAWCCFDEFNRIDIEVLSVIAQQLITIRNAKVARATDFMFEGRKIKLVMSCAAFVTMNPGYAGRTELPDNLKSLFRPISMMVPDYKLIAEVTLYSEGFESSKILSVKMTLLYTLCSEQLSQQDHYDFGMRAVKSVLVMAGSLKRENPDKSEQVVLMRALRDSNLPKFLADDAQLFRGILGDLFPNVEIPEEDYGILAETAVTIMEEAGLQAENCSIAKTIQLHETMQVRHGVMLVGPTGSGKTTVLRTLRDAYTRLHDIGATGQAYQAVHMYVLNPKAVTIGQLYGEINTLTNEWHDGLVGSIVRTACSFVTEEHQWVVCDGPVDAVWIENMNTVLDDNKMLCLANSERIKFTPYVHMVFEVMDLAQASPATVSRCGMVYVDPAELGWLPYVKSWVRRLEMLNRDLQDLIVEFFETYVGDGLGFFKKNCEHAIAQVDISKVSMCCALMESILLEPGSIDKSADRSRVNTFLIQSFIFSYIWGIGGNVIDVSRETFELFVKEQFDENAAARLPSSGDLWSLYINVPNRRMDLWVKLMPAFVYDKEQPFFEILVPTIDTVRFGYIVQKLVQANKPVFVTGATGVGKSVITKVVLKNLQESTLWLPISLNFSAQTSSGRTQEILELKLEKKKRAVLGAPYGKRVCVFVDDVNMPKLDTYGSQPPIELLRQLLDLSGFYDRDKLFWKSVEDVILSVACAPPGGGRNPLTPRFVRHFGMLVIPSPDEASLKAIFRSIIRGFLQDFAQPVMEVGDRIVGATVEIYNKIALDLLPTPEKSHYVFNLRDLSKCVQGMLQADSSSVREARQMLRLFYHECLRVFHDRLINLEDKSYFYHLVTEMCSRSFGDQVVPLPPGETIIERPPLLFFGDFMSFGAPPEDRTYEEIFDVEKMKSVLRDYLDDYCIVTNKEMKLIFFMDAIEHLCRIARILRSERGNGLLVGVGGMGKQSLTKLASHLNGYPCYQIQVSRGYDLNSWHEDLRRFYLRPGARAENSTFLFTDTQIVMEEFLEDINNTLNSGEVPNLFEADELEKAIIETRPAAKEAGIAEENRDGIYDYFIARVRNHLHLVLCMSPVGDAFRRRCRMFPSLVNCCTIDWFTNWPREALLSVAESSINPLVPDDPDKLAALSSICVLMHKSVEETTLRFFNEMRRRYYTTPSSYLELIKLYLSTLDKKKNEILTLQAKIANGLNKLYETNEMVAVMKEQLLRLGPKLKTSSEEVSNLMKVVAKQQIECDKVRSVVAADEAAAKLMAEETAALELDARKDLEAALPALREAQKALEALNKNDIIEIKVFNKPPHLVRFVMEAVCLLLDEKTDWPSAKRVLADPAHFLERLMSYPKDDISDKLLKKLQDYVTHPEFLPQIVAKQSKVCKSICIWVRAIDGYAKIYRIVEPKRAVLLKAQNELWAIEAVLQQKQQQLQEVEKKIKRLQDQYDGAVKNLADLEYNMNLSEARLNRSGRLTAALSDEQVRWNQLVKGFDGQINNLTGDCLVAAGCLAYLGAFTNLYRQQLLESWLSGCKTQQIVTTPNFNLVTVLADPYVVRTWNTHGLPKDRVSTENAILVTRAGRWPLMIDPQEQANRWIRNMEEENNLQICKMTDTNFMRIMEGCIRIGAPILLQQVGETLDPSLEPVLLKQTFVQGGRTLIRLGDSDIEYDSNFKLYLTTKMANPHYLPEVCIKVTIVNFTVTPSGLEDQLLADVVRLERPDLEKLRNELIGKINADKAQLQSIEDKILSLLFSSGDDILDNEELIETLNDSKETSAIIGSRLLETEATEEKISIAREKYRSVATRGSVLYFVVGNLAEIDPMYQFSLKYFTQIFNNVIETSEKDYELEIRLNILYDEITLSVYTNVSRGLFERHKLVFSFMLNVAIYLNAEIISYPEWNFLLRGAAGQPAPTKKPDYPTLSESMWDNVNYLATNFPPFKHIMRDALKRIPISIEYFQEEMNVVPSNNERATNNWDENLSDMEKLMLIKCLKEEKLIFGVTGYVKKNMGQRFVESAMTSLPEIFRDTSNAIPLVFVLSTGSDPFGAFQRFAGEMGFTEKYESISLGQGQGPIAETLVKRGTVEGHWIFLQNCHLATSWMLAMERLVISITENPQTVHQEFRLFFSSMPSSAFPVSVLQNSVKVTNEPPKGLKANVKRAFYELNQDFFENHDLKENWRTMIFGVCFFHAIVQERKKFGPLGWNILYEFNDNDRDCCLLNLRMFCQAGIIPWDALIYTTGEITYGGRITDGWDLRCLKTILANFFSPETLLPNYTYSPSGTYFCPQLKSLNEYRNFIDRFPIIEDPEIFGMHENANITYQLKETKLIINTILEVQPNVEMGTEGRSTSEIVFEIADRIVAKIDVFIDPDICNPNHVKKDSAGRIPSLTTVLLHEVDRYNKLLSKLHVSMDNLQRAIKGFVVMSDELERVFKALVNNQVPQLWHSVNVYPSLKTLGSWTRDLELRIDFIRIWLSDKQPISFWLSGLSFPQGFITGMLQTHARKYNVPIDQLKLDFSVTKEILDQEDIEAAHNVANQEVYSVYKNLEPPIDGVFTHGLFLDAGRWDLKFMVLVDAKKGEMNPPMPVIHINPVKSLPEKDPRYVCPLYKTSIRAGVLSTTGHSTNFVVPILLPSARDQAYWILKGTALLVQVTN